MSGSEKRMFLASKCSFSGLWRAKVRPSILRSWVVEHRSHMSDFNNRNRPSDIEPAMVVFFICVAAVVIPLLVFATTVAGWFGSEYWTTFGALVRAAIGLVVTLGAVFAGYHFEFFKASRVKSAIGLILSVIAFVIAWTFGKVADSAGMGGVDPDRVYSSAGGLMPYNMNTSWYSGGVQWLVCFALIAAVIVFAYLAMQDDD